MRYITGMLAAGLLMAAPAKKLVLGQDAKADPLWGQVRHGGTARTSAYFPESLTVLLEDSAMNEFTIWSTLMDPLDMAGPDKLAFYHRQWTPSGFSGYTKLHWTSDGGQTWYSIDSFNYKVINDPDYETNYGGGRYPDATYISEDMAVGAWPELTPGPDWGHMCIGTGLQDGSVRGQVGEDLDVHKSVGLLLPDGKVLNVGYDVNYVVYLGVYDPQTGDYVVAPEGMIADFYFSNADYDPINNVIYLFGTDASMGAGYYTATWDGTNLTLGDFMPFYPPPQIDLGGGYVLDTYVSDDGGLIIDTASNTVIPVYVYGLASYQTMGDTLEKAIVIATEDTAYIVVQLTTDENDFLYYGQIVTSYDGKLAIVYEKMTRADANVGWGWYDIYVTTTTMDNLGSWSEPVNLTNTDDVNESLVHTPDHFFGLGNGIYKLCMVYGVDVAENTDLYWDGWMSGSKLPITHLYVACTELTVDVEESSPAQRPSYRFDGRELHFVGLPAGTVLKVYDITGRVVKEVKLTSSRVSLADLGSGAYFFRAGKLAGKVVVR